MLLIHEIHVLTSYIWIDDDNNIYSGNNKYDYYYYHY